MIKQLILLATLSLTFSALSGQVQAIDSTKISSDFSAIKSYEDTLGLLSFIIINDSIEENRFIAVKKFIPTLVKALKEKNSFDYPFERLRSISIQYPEDRSFRIFTWQLYVNEKDYRYYGAIQMNTGELKLFPLRDRSALVKNPEQDILPPDQWYGAVYYNLRQFETPEGPKYLLFGYDGYSFFSKRKVLDVLSFKDGKPVFGAPVFMSEGKSHKNRVVLTYSAETSVKLNYEEYLDIIIFDHLIEAIGSIPGKPPVTLPDGSYEGYKLENGQWVHIDKVFDQVSEEAPRDHPVLGNKKRKDRKDIFGRQ